MHYGNIKWNDIANGEGVRVSLFVSGCKNHCPFCFNRETWDFNYGNEFTNLVAEKILNAIEPYWINGLTILGGEPMEIENQKSVHDFVIKFREKFGNTKTIWVYTGYLFDQDLVAENGKRHTEYTLEILKNIDIMVDGRFVNELKNLSLKFRGSENQRIILVKESLDKGEVILSPLNKFTNFKPRD
jgi:anaerobic ribonucleoside-triphosphate reductase activating protein